MTENHNDCNLESLANIELFLHLLMTKFESYQQLQDKLTYENYVCASGNKLLFHLKCLPSYIQYMETLDLTQFRYIPRIQAFCDCVTANPIPDRGLFELICRCPQPSERSTGVQLEQMRGFVSRFLSDLYERLQATKMSVPLDHRERDVTSPFTTMSACVDKLFAEEAQYMVVRVDLSYPKSTQGQDKSHNRQVEFDTIKSDWNRLYSEICRSDLFKGLDGYIYRVEYVAEKGLRIRAMFFFDEMLCHLDDVILARDICSIWRFNIQRYGSKH